MTLKLIPILALFLLLPCSPTFSAAQAQPRLAGKESLRLGYIGSLSGFAASYGRAVLEGLQLALDEEEKAGKKLQLLIEDDQSSTKNAVTSYTKLARVDKIDGLITGTWWANAIVKPSEKDRLPFISCETLYNDDVVLGSNYFLIEGDLSTWIRVFEPLVQARGYRRGAILRFASGFGVTLAREAQILFSRQGRNFAGEVEYSDIQVPDAASLISRVKSLKADVLYIDAQPAALAILLRKFKELGLSQFPIFTNTIVRDLIKQKLLDLSDMPNIYFSQRQNFSADFSRKFEERYHRPPELNADLGYYAGHLLVRALESPDAIQTLKAGKLSVDGLRFAFDEHNVYHGLKQELWHLKNGVPERLAF